MDQEEVSMSESLLSKWDGKDVILRYDQPTGTLILTAAVLHSVLTWEKGFWTVDDRIHYPLVTLAAMGMMWFSTNWKVLG